MIRPVQIVRVLLVLLICFAIPSAHAASVFLEDFTWTELRDAIAAGDTIAIVPVGGTEQNGPHMALGKHNVRVRLLAERIARSLGNAIVAPVIAYVPEGSIDPPAAHMRFPGTISVPAPVFAAVIESAARSLRRAGFRDVVLIGDHGGYQDELSKVAGRLNRESKGSAFRVHAIDIYYRVTQTDFAQQLRRRGVTDEQIGSHAGLADTSLTLALAPSLVRQDVMRSPSARQSNGVTGDPAGATPVLGTIGVDLVVTRSTEAIRSAVRR